MSYDAARAAVLETCRVLVERGFLAGTGGNVAVRADEGHMAVTPSATDYRIMSLEDISVLRLPDLEPVAGRARPSVESGLHARLLRSRPACGASVHTHQPVASAYTLLGRPLDVRAPEHQALLGPRVPCAGYAPSGTGWLTSRVARALGPDGRACLMRNHGVVCVAETPELALRCVEALEGEAAAFFEEEVSRRRLHLPAAVAERVLGSLRTHPGIPLERPLS